MRAAIGMPARSIERRGRRLARALVAVQRAALSVLMVFLLLIAQHAAHAHALTHFDHRAPATENKQLPHTKACERCGISAQLGTGLLSHPTAIRSIATCECLVSHRPQTFHPTAPRRFLSRAPPRSD